MSKPRVPTPEQITVRWADKDTDLVPRDDRGQRMTVTQRKIKHCPCGLPMRWKFYTKTGRWICYPCERSQNHFQKQFPKNQRHAAYVQWKRLNRTLRDDVWQLSLDAYMLVIEQISKYTPRAPKEITERARKTRYVSDRLVAKALQIGLRKGDIKRDGVLMRNGFINIAWEAGYLLV